MPTAEDVITIPAFPALTLGFIVFFVGAFLTRRVAFLKDYNIPEPVSGGFFAALVTWAVYVWIGREIIFDLSVRDELLVIFFATIGLNARVADLISGGRLLVVMLGLTIGFMVLQNLVALIGVSIFGLPSGASVLMGTASLIGGHGTAIAWGPTVEARTGFDAAAEIGISAATLGLICAALLGGPIAKFLIERNGLSPEVGATHTVGLSFEKDAQEQESVNHVNLMGAMLAAHIAVIFGYVVHLWITEAGVKLPLFVPCLLVGIVLSNTVPYIFPSLPWPARTKALAVVSDYSLSVFLAMSLMSLKLWTLAGLGLPLLSVLAAQVVAAALFIVLIVYWAMGRDYTAAVLCAGFAGFSLGATPTAIANMSSVTKRYGPAPLAFIILPLVSAFFVDVANAFIIDFFVGLSG